MATSIIVLIVVVAVAAILLTVGFMRLPRTKATNAATPTRLAAPPRRKQSTSWAHRHRTQRRPPTTVNLNTTDGARACERGLRTMTAPEPERGLLVPTETTPH